VIKSEDNVDKIEKLKQFLAIAIPRDTGMAWPPSNFNKLDHDSLLYQT